MCFQCANVQLQHSVHFKAYIDQVVRVGRTFMEENGQVKGLANGKSFVHHIARR